MISVKEAHDIIDNNTFVIDKEYISINDVTGRILAEDILASFSQPRFLNSAMDGFALRSQDTIGASNNTPILLRNIDVSSAGSPSELMINSGECIQCMTGAKIPKGADAVIMVEHTSGFSDNENIQIINQVDEGKNIRKIGEEIKKGELLIRKGTKITASELGICATFGYGELAVMRRPKVAIFATGNELIEPGEQLKEGEIYNSNLFVFSELSKILGAEVIVKKVIKDSKTSLRKFLSKALGLSDLVISSGGVSMGRYDYVREVFMDLGVKEHFWKVAQKPGKPLFFGTGKDTLIFGLPGNPVSSYIGYMEWVWPTIKYMLSKEKITLIKAILNEKFPKEKEKHRFLFGKVWSDKGKLLCKPSTKVGSHMLSSSLDANCILSSEPGEGELNIGDEISVNILPWKTIE